MERWIYKKYGRWLVSNLSIAMVFVTVFIPVVIFVGCFLNTDEDTTLAEIGTMTSITGVFLGTFIAVWLVNRDHTRMIKEVFFHKTHVLECIESMLFDMNQFYGKSYEDNEIDNTKKTKILEYDRNVIVIDHRQQIKIINSNVFIPIDIRFNVKSFLCQGITFIRFFSKPSGEEKQHLETAFGFLDSVTDSKYFKDEKDKEIQTGLERVKNLKSQLKM